MSQGSTIEWLNRPGTKPASWNPIRARDKATGKVGWHCEHVSDGCRNCYAEAINANRFGTRRPYKPDQRDHVEIFLDEKTLLAPLTWRKPHTVFVCSMSDLFGAWVRDNLIDRVFAVMALCPQHTFIVLTKRSDRMREYMTAARLSNVQGWHSPLPNVWLGVSVEDQRTANERILDLLSTPAAIRFISAEPLLGALDVSAFLLRGDAGLDDDPPGRTLLGLAVEEGNAWVRPRLDWVIVGGESGTNARPMHPDWARSLRDQCQAAGVAFFFKQWGNWKPIEHRDNLPGRPQMVSAGDCFITGDGEQHIIGHDLSSHLEGDEPEPMRHVANKKSAGRTLDGRTWDEFPEPRP